MSRYRLLWTLVVILGLAATVSTASAQFSFGIGIGSGRGSGFYYGRGGYYGPGYYGRGYYGPGYYGPGYYGPGYGSGIGVRVGNLGYYDYDDDYYGRRGYYYARPQVNQDYILPNNIVGATERVLPDNKITPTRLTLKEGDILIRSPQDAPGDVGYGVNDRWIYTIKPGQKQKLDAGRQWTIEFHRGIEGTEPARYALDPGIYEFHFSEESGWDLSRVGENVLPPPPQAIDPDQAGKPATDDVPLPAEPPKEE